MISATRLGNLALSIKSHLAFAFTIALIAQISCHLSAFANDDLTDGISLYQAKDYKKAAPIFLRSTQSHNTPTANYYLALCYQQLNLQPRAMELFKQICKQWPGTAEARLAGEYLQRFDASGTRTQDSRSAIENTAVPQVELGKEHISKAEWDALPNKTRIPFLTESGHLMVQAKINGKYCKMAFDSGASFCTISRSDFPDVIPESEYLKGKAVPISRPHGLTLMKQCSADVTLQDINRRVTVFVTDEPHVSVIGENFFSDYTYQIDGFYIRMAKAPYPAEPNSVSDSKILTTLSQNSAQQKKIADRYSIPFEKHQNIMLIDIEVNGHRTKACFDTGCAVDGLVCPPTSFTPFGLTRQRSTVRDSQGNTREAEVAMAERLVVGPITKTYVKAYAAAGLTFPLIGPKIFDRPYTVDQNAQCIRFDY